MRQSAPTSDSAEKSFQSIMMPADCATAPVDHQVVGRAAGQQRHHGVDDGAFIDDMADGRKALTR
jgi:hypothetical protein